ncbi:MAG: hypothetical protein DRI90_01245 [Deltaproteobacteria bacterium]|nr:MAG: hypothetical protein DRI90_01245 [Deltaproteobacteria bacterium]
MPLPLQITPLGPRHKPIAALTLLSAIFMIIGCSDEPSQSGTTTSSGSGGAGGGGGSGGAGAGPHSLRVAQYNIYFLDTSKLTGAGPQIEAAVQVVTRFNPDVLAVNEFQYDVEGTPPPPGTINGSGLNGARLMDRLNAVTQGAPYTHHLITFGNSGVSWSGYDGATDDPYFSEAGEGSTPGMFNYAIISRYPILADQARLIVDVPWLALEGHSGDALALATGITVPEDYPLFAKGLLIVPIQVGDHVLHVIANHPFPPIAHVVRPYRHHDEILGMKLLLDGNLPGVDPLPPDARFVIAGDLNVDPDDGDALPGTIDLLFDHPLVIPSQPADGYGSVGHTPEQNTQASACPSSSAPDPSTENQFQLDYLMPSTSIGEPLGTGMFFPDPTSTDWALACEASDHMLLWADLPW